MIEYLALGLRNLHRPKQTGKVLLHPQQTAKAFVMGPCQPHLDRILAAGSSWVLHVSTFPTDAEPCTLT